MLAGDADANNGCLAEQAHHAFSMNATHSVQNNWLLVRCSNRKGYPMARKWRATELSVGSDSVVGDLDASVACPHAPNTHPENQLRAGGTSNVLVLLSTPNVTAADTTSMY
jgi:hypothetical protein